MRNNQKGFIHAAVIILLLLGLGAGFYLVQKTTNLKPKASLDTTRMEITGPSVSGDRTNSRNIKVRLVYVPPAPSPSPTVNPTSTPTPSIIPSANPSVIPTPDTKEGFCSSDQDCPEGYICPEIMSFAPGPIAVDKVCQLGKPRSPVPVPTTKTGVNSFGVSGPCDSGYKFANFDCYDGFSGQVGNENTCRTSDQLSELTKEQCQNRSSAQRVKGINIYAQALFPSHFRIANTQAGLEIAPVTTFTQNNQEIDWELSEGNGLKTIYAQFKINGVWESPISTTITLDTLQTTPSPVSSPIENPTNPICQDLSLRIQRAYRSECGSDQYDIIADINKDRLVNSLDQGQLRQNENNQQWCQQKLADPTNPCTQTIPTSSPTPSLSPSPTSSATPPSHTDNLESECQNLFNTIRQSYRTACGDNGFNPVADINKDRVVNSLDLSQLNRNQSNERWCTEKLADSSNHCINSVVSNPTPVPSATGNLIQQIWQNITSAFK